MNDVIAEILYPRRAAAWVLGLSGLAGLLLAVVGVYSVVSYSVAQQLRDVGIRSTLGASHGDIVALFLATRSRYPKPLPVLDGRMQHRPHHLPGAGQPAF